jgi:hypothetical protein
MINEYDKIVTKLKTVNQNFQQISENITRKANIKAESLSKLENCTKSKANHDEIINEYLNKQKKAIEQTEETINVEKEKLEQVMLLVNDSNEAIRIQIQNNNLYDQKVNFGLF